MKDLLLIAIIAGGGFGLLFAYVNEMMKKAGQILHLDEHSVGGKSIYGPGISDLVSCYCVHPCRRH